ncbi:glutamate racemase [Methylovirgula ligni]|uniref:Glutamate racemase n=1 Tax=Methylovirgula ligni TaxID=569860 RepID=A0A3D9YV52_9HYPH|nr:glutamate racemase [Methylovirgula ligni]QAY95942.1 glutamate racemase [Methylovirgula ligni]REF86394.1 glutamate racemase [Methylovirgula ligni]
MPKPPHVVVFDSGLGGLTVLTEVMRQRPDAQCLYVADDAGFPYGRLSEPDLIKRVGTVVARLVGDYAPDAIVIACNTASTLVLPHLRAAYPGLPFIGTVPAIKPAATRSASKLISILATPGTVARDYTHDLVRTYAAHCDVTLVGSTKLASLAEAFMKGEPVSDVSLTDEIAPSFVEKDGLRTDCIVLACTHYPLLLAQFERLAPWPVVWIDPAEAIARRLDHVLREDLGRAPAAQAAAGHTALFTSGAAPSPALAAALAERGIVEIAENPIPMQSV